MLNIYTKDKENDNMSRFKQFIEKIYLSWPDNLVFVDSMTEVNTKSYYDKIVKPKYDDKEVFVAFVDVNDLKKINDEKGHHEGNKVIKAIAKQLKLLDVLEVCRVGGDEFVVIANKDFNPSNLNYIENAAYGYVIKKPEQKLYDAAREADFYMYKRKKKLKRKEEMKNNFTREESSKNDLNKKREHHRGNRGGKNRRHDNYNNKFSDKKKELVHEKGNAQVI